MDDIYKNIENYNPNEKRKISIIFDNVIADMLNYKNFNALITEIFIRGRKLNISLFLLHNFILLFRKVLD